MNTSTKFSPDIRSLILLWAFAESAIGGMLHAFKLPFTGIFVGGLAVICIALIGFYQQSGQKHILEALGIVILVKLAISPHSPWQAYVAVVFQGYLGHLIFISPSFFKSRVLLFSIICMFESAFQKVIIANIVLGANFLESIDQAALAITNSLGMTANISAVWAIFGSYILIHVILGIYLAFWIPKIPLQLEELNENMPAFDSNNTQYHKVSASQSKVIIVTIILFILILMGIKWWLPHIPTLDLVFIFIRTVVVSLLLIFIVGPLIKNLIVSRGSNISIDKKLLQEVIADIPAFSHQAFNWLNYVRQTHTGINKIKTFILGLLVISAKYKN